MNSTITIPNKTMKLDDAAKGQIVEARRVFDGASCVFADQWAALIGVSRQTIYRVLKDAGLGSGRKRRNQVSSVPDDDVQKLHDLLNTTRRKNNQVLGTTEEAIRILQNNGEISSDVSTATHNRRLREMSLTALDIKREKAWNPILSEHPNRMWEFDATPCVMYFLDDKGAFAANDDFKLEVSRKPEDFKKIKKHLVRYAIIDHCSGAFYFRYFYSAGENTSDVINFLYHSMAPKDDKRYPFRGVPLHLWSDKGSAMDNKSVRNLCANLGVEFTAHMAGNPRAKGAVEVTNNLLTRWFEAWLPLQYPHTLEELNEWAFDLCVEKNYTGLFRHTDTRTNFWMTITEDQLRDCPPKEIFGRCAVTEPVKRMVKANLMVSYGGNQYRLPSNPAFNGQAAYIRFNAYDTGQAEVILFKGTEKEVSYMLDPISKDRYGRVIDPATAQRVGAPRAVKDSAQEKAAKQSEEWLKEKGVMFKGTGSHRRAFPIKDFEGERLKVFGDRRNDLPDIDLMPKRGTELAVTKNAREKPEPLIKTVSAMLEITGALGRDLFRSENKYIKEVYPDGLTASDIENVIAFFTQQDDGDNVVEMGGRK